MKNRLIPALLMALAIAMTQSLIAADKAADKAKDCKCPVSGAPAKAEHAVAYEGKQVFFCCPNCPKAFTANPEKFANQAKHQLACTGQITQVACPLSGGPIKADTAIDVQGVQIAFCCPNCQAKVKSAEGQEQLALVFANLDKGFTKQTACPVSGKPIKAEFSVDHKGKKVYFCCPNCPKAFAKDPSKFESKL